MRLVWDMIVNLNKADHGVGFQWPKDCRVLLSPGHRPLRHYLPLIKIFLMLTIYYHDLNHSFFIIS